MTITIQNLSTNYAASNTVIPLGEFALETNTGKIKLGDGITPWNSLTYITTDSGSNITIGAGKTLDVSAGTLTLTNDQISGDKVQGGTIGSTTITTLTSTTANITTVDTNVAAAKLQISGTTIQAAGSDATVDVNIGSKSTGTINLQTNSSTQWSINGSGALNPSTDNAKDIGNLAVNPRDITASRSFTKKGIDSTTGYGQLALKSSSASKTLTNAQTNTLAIQIPSGAMLIGVQLRNDTIIAGLDDATGLVPITTYSAIYATGATQTINATIAVAQNTKVNKFFDANAATNITSDITDITLDSGVGNKFTADGVISAVAYYYELTSITDL